MPPPPLVTSRSAAAGENSKLGRTGGAPAAGVGRRKVNPRKPEPKNRWPGKDTSSSNEFFPAIQIMPAARGLELPVVMESARTMFRPSFGATMIPTGAPSPPKAGEPSIREICVVAGLSPINAVVGLEHERAAHAIGAAREKQHRVLVDGREQGVGVVGLAIARDAERTDIGPLVHRGGSWNIRCRQLARASRARVPRGASRCLSHGHLRRFPGPARSDPPRNARAGALMVSSPA